jgi:SAM-dependent methyltransferase
MNDEEFKKMAELEDTYWWHVGRKSILAQHLLWLGKKQQRILNVGCGTGGLISLFEQYGEVTNIDTSPEAIKYCSQKGHKNVHLLPSGPLPYADKTFDLVLATDVLEHIEDDLAALQDWRRVMKDDGTLIMTVPAYQWLWSAHDEALQHFRRYSVSQLHHLVNRAGFVVNKRSYAIVFAFPLIVGFRFLSSLVEGFKSQSGKKQHSSYVILPKPLNRVLILFLQIEAHLLKYINFPFGTSIILNAGKSAI